MGKSNLTFREREWEYNGLTKRAIYFTVFNLLIVSLAYISAPYITFDDSEIWFQRVGAIVVCTSLLIEFKFSNLSAKIISLDKEFESEVYKVDGSLESGIKSADEELISEYGKYVNKYGLQHSTSFKVLAANMLLGTVVWGYGDLIFKYLLN